MIQTQPAEVHSFLGGIVDDYVNASADRYAIGNNLVILADESLQSRPGSEIDDLLEPQIPPGAQPIRTLINFDHNNALLVQSGKRMYFRDPSSYATLTGPTGNHLFDVGDNDSISSNAQWKGHDFITSNDFPRIQKIYRDGSGVLQLRNAGLPALASSPVVTAGIAGSNTYLYAFHYSYTYTSKQEEFVDYGPVTLVELDNSGDPSVNPNSISAIPVLSNGATENWDTTVIKVKIFRSINGGTTYYEIGEVTNGTTVFVDNFSDAIISDNVVIYIAGGVVDNDPPPGAKFVHIIKNTGYYAYLKEGSQVLPNDVIQSKINDPDSVPGSFRDTVEDEIAGLNSVREIPIVACRKHIYRIEGLFDDLGRGFMQHVRIHDSAGCISNNSFVQAEQNLYWAGNDGFYFTDGYRCMKISDNINDTYRAMVIATRETGDPMRITGKFDEINRRILWNVQIDSASENPDAVFCLDIRNGPASEMPMTTWSGVTGGDQAMTGSFIPTALEFLDDQFYRADSRGFVFKHDPALPDDPKVDLLEDPADWHRETVIWHYRSIASNFGNNFVRKWVPRMLITCKNRTNLSVGITAINDDGKITRPLAELRYRNNLIWGDPEFTWGNPLCVWNAEGLIEQWRRMPAKGLRLSYLQMDFTNAYTVISSSDDSGTVTVNPTLKTALLNLAGAAWPLESVDYFISFENDNYDKQYLVTSRSTDTLVFSDAENSAPVGVQNWLLQGYRKGEVFNLLSYTIHFAMLSKSQTNTAVPSTGANAS